MSLSAHTKLKAPLKDRLIPWYFVMAFMVVASVNVYFVYIATSSNGGVVTENAYEKGLDYNEILKKSHQQQSLHWKSTLDYMQQQLRFTLKDKDNLPLTGATVTAYIQRPLQTTYHFDVLLQENNNGVYFSNTKFPLKGQWDVTVSVVWNKQSYQMQQRLVIR